jgi:hypothetical protein
MAAQHKRHGRTAIRRRQERAYERLAARRDELERYRSQRPALEFEQRWGREDRRVCRELAELAHRIAQPLLPVPPKQPSRPHRRTR